MLDGCRKGNPSKAGSLFLSGGGLFRLHHRVQEQNRMQIAERATLSGPMMIHITTVHQVADPTRKYSQKLLRDMSSTFPMSMLQIWTNARSK